MNLLAHAFLADGDPDRIVGQLCGDFVRGADLSDYPPAVQLGIRCHRAVDSFTDRHEINREARALFVSPHRRFAGIAVDVMYDHFLASDWHHHSDVPLVDYTAGVTTALLDRHDILPAGLQRFVELLQVEDTLRRNLEREHIELTLSRISSRRQSMAPLASVAPVMWQHETALKRSFDRFFPQLVSYTQHIQKTFGSENSVGR